LTLQLRPPSPPQLLLEPSIPIKPFTAPFLPVGSRVPQLGLIFPSLGATFLSWIVWLNFDFPPCHFPTLPFASREAEPLVFLSFFLLAFETSPAFVFQF